MPTHQQIIFSVLIGFGIASFAMAENTTYGTNAGAALTTGTLDNVMVGENAGAANQSGDYMVAIGANAGRYFNDYFASGTLVGFDAGASGTDFSSSTLLGTRAGYNLTTGRATFFGFEAGFSSTTEDYQTLAGSGAGYYSTGGSAAYNSYLGYRSGYFIAGKNNTAVGSEALYGKVAGNSAIQNTVFGFRAAYGIGEGDGNVAFGEGAGYDLDAGSYNTILGARAGERLQDNSSNYNGNDVTASTFVGALAGLGSENGAISNSFLGAGAGAANATGDNNLVIGAFADFADWSTVDDSGREAIFSADFLSSTGMTALAADANRGTLIGAAGKLSADDVVGLGYGVTVSATGAIAIGSGASATHAESVVLGYGAQSLGDYLVVLGNSSTTVWLPNADNVTSLGSSSNRFSNLFTRALDITAASGSALAITLAADAAEDAGDSWQLGAADGSDLSFSNDISGNQSVLFSLSNGGDLTMAGDVNVLSDRRYKKNISPVAHAMHFVNQLHSKRYFWQSDTGRDSHEHFGLIAQEVAKVLPEIVKAREDGYLSVNYPALLPLLAQAGGELADKQDQQKHQLDQLASRLDAIEAALAEAWQ